MSTHGISQLLLQGRPVCRPFAQARQQKQRSVCVADACRHEAAPTRRAALSGAFSLPAALIASRGATRIEYSVDCGPDYPLPFLTRPVRTDCTHRPLPLSRVTLVCAAWALIPDDDDEDLVEKAKAKRSQKLKEELGTQKKFARRHAAILPVGVPQVDEPRREVKPDLLHVGC